MEYNDDMDKKANMLQKEEKVKRIKAEIKRLNGLFRGMDAKTKKVVKPLIENAAFMSVTLEDLQNHINLHGVTDKYQNGANQWGTKKSPEVEIHLQMTKNHTQIMKQLSDLLPKATPKTKGDGFEEFVNSR
jgi:hypothetical protein